MDGFGSFLCPAAVSLSTFLGLLSLSSLRMRERESRKEEL
jgi:hypothetical protein